MLVSFSACLQHIPDQYLVWCFSFACLQHIPGMSGWVNYGWGDVCVCVFVFVFVCVFVCCVCVGGCLCMYICMCDKDVYGCVSVSVVFPYNSLFLFNCCFYLQCLEPWGPLWGVVDIKRQRHCRQRPRLPHMVCAPVYLSNAVCPLLVWVFFVVSVLNRSTSAILLNNPQSLCVFVLTRLCCTQGIYGYLATQKRAHDTEHVRDCIRNDTELPWWHFLCRA